MSAIDIRTFNLSRMLSICKRNILDSKSKIKWNELPPEIWKHVIGFIDKLESSFMNVQMGMSLPSVRLCIDSPTVNVGATSKMLRSVVMDHRSTHPYDKTSINEEFFKMVANCVWYVASNRFYVQDDTQEIMLYRNNQGEKIGLCTVTVQYVKSAYDFHVKLTYSRGVPAKDNTIIVEIVTEVIQYMFNATKKIIFGDGRKKDDDTSLIVLPHEYTLQRWDRTPADSAFIANNKQIFMDDVFARLVQITGSDFYSA
jgi:hypothetical protein